MEGQVNAGNPMGGRSRIASKRERTSVNNATLAHLTWHATDVERTRLFLESLLGWQFSDAGDGYYVCQPDGGARVGLTRGPTHGNGPVAFLPHVAVEDLAATLERARSMDPDMVLEEGTIPTVGTFADVRDPDGATFTLIEFDSAR
jgi:predicted enzyme related to lactoylglutathione lyase